MNTLTLNELINRLIEVRDTDPVKGNEPVYVWQQDGDRYPIQMIDETVEGYTDINIPSYED